MNDMMTFSWILHNHTEYVNPPLYLLNAALQKAGGVAKIESGVLDSRLIIEFSQDLVPAGRPRVHAKEDLTIAQILHARFMNVPMTEIAQKLGVSVRTLHRRWSAATKAHISPDTPYSQWP